MAQPTWNPEKAAMRAQVVIYKGNPISWDFVCDVIVEDCIYMYVCVVIKKKGGVDDRWVWLLSLYSIYSKKWSLKKNDKGKKEIKEGKK